VRQRVSLEAFESLWGLMHVEEYKGKRGSFGEDFLKAFVDLTKAWQIRYFIKEMEALRYGGLQGYYRFAKGMDDRPEVGWSAVLRPHESLVRGAVSGYSALMPGLIYNESRRRMLLIACALERFRLAHPTVPIHSPALPKEKKKIFCPP
jgi:hypothetical protein